MSFSAVDFVAESNRIEGILRGPTTAEVSEHMRFVQLERVSIADLEQFVSIYQPGKKLRTKHGMNVYVGDHVPPPGGDEIAPALQVILDNANVLASPTYPTKGRHRIAYNVHFAYETLHPFMDGNGRSGRALWAWCMRQTPIGFLHHWYYQTLQFGREGERP